MTASTADNTARVWDAKIGAQLAALGGHTVSNAVWSPDSKWIAYSHDEREGMNRVRLYSLDSCKSTAVTEGRYNSGAPCFSGDGKYLFFVSARDFNPIISNTEWNHAYTDMQKIYLVTLA